MAHRSMTIGLDVSALAGPGTGIARYTYELLGALRSIAGEAVVPVGNRVARGLPGSRDGIAVEGPTFPSRAAWTFGLLPVWLSRSGLDVFHATSYYAPLRTGVPVVVTVHDLSAFARPDLHPRGRVLRAHVAMPRVVRRADAVIVPTGSVQADAVRWLGVAPDRVHVVAEAPAGVFGRRPPRQAVVAALDRHRLEPRFFLAIGTLEPRKNLARVVAAIERVAATGDDARLVVAGPAGWKFGPIAELVRRRGLGERVRFVGFVPDKELVALMSAATALVYPSLYEGFGLPVVEAMAAGLPVVTSNSGALAEIAGDAALLVDPLCTDDIARAMRRVSSDTALSSDLSARGLARAAGYSWARTARETLAVYAAAIDRARIAA